VDGTFGSTNLQFSKRGRLAFRRIVCIIALGAGAFLQSSNSLAEESNPAKNVNSNDPMHWSAKKTVWNRRENKVELLGNGAVHRQGESVTADYIRLDLKNRVVEAKGNCVYVASETVIFSDELRFNLDTSAGSIINGRVTNGGFLIVGERINRLSPTRFQSHNSEYTTCHDCPGSWSLHAKDVDMEIEGYAHLTGVTGKIKDAPVFWAPYIIIPIKTKRQTGFLFPKFGQSDLNGFMFVEPFFWVLGRSADMTIGLGNYSERGFRAEIEGRYAAVEGEGTANYFYLSDTKDDEPTKRDRWALKLDQYHELPFSIIEKLKISETGDNLYPIQFADDIEGQGEPVLTSRLSFAKATPQYGAYVEGRRYRNLINFDDPVGFDKRTVQLAPQAELTTTDYFMFNSNVAAGVNLALSNFIRQDGPVDHDVDRADTEPLDPGHQDPIREATRVSIRPKLYTTMRLNDVIEVVPKAEYHSYYYSFPGDIDNVGSLQRGYMHLNTEISTQIERVYRWDDPNIPRFKHLIRPRVSYSRIPLIHEPGSHPFIAQIGRNDRNGYNFDNRDIVPKTTPSSLINYFTPQGHSISYGVTSQLIRRRSPVETLWATYERSIEFDVAQTFNILELQNQPDDRVPLSRVSSRMELMFDHLVSATEYYYYPFLGRLLPAVHPRDRTPHEFSTSWKWIWEKSFHQKVMEFERSIALSYSFRKLDSKTSNMNGSLSYSINDYFLPRARASYDFNAHRFSNVEVDLHFQSPSRCWRFSLFTGRSIESGRFIKFKVDFNFTGEGFGGVSDLAG